MFRTNFLTVYGILILQLVTLFIFFRIFFQSVFVLFFFASVVLLVLIMLV